MTRREDKQLVEHVATYKSWNEMKPMRVEYDTNLAILVEPEVGGRIVYLVKVARGFWATDHLDMLSLEMRKRARHMCASL